MSIEFRPLKAEEVEVRVGTCNEKGCSLLLYKDARVDMSLLDEVVGPENWECYYESIDGKLFCTVTISLKHHPDDKFRSTVSKQDVGVPSNMEAQKGEASDAFKRACFKWGIGRELYTAPFIWVPSDKCNIKPGRNGKMQCYDKFRVTEMEVENGAIVKLTVVNQSRKDAVVFGSKAAKPKAESELPGRRRMWEAIKAWAEAHGRSAEEVLNGVKKRPEWESQHMSDEWLTSVAVEFEQDLDG